MPDFSKTKLLPNAFKPVVAKSDPGELKSIYGDVPPIYGEEIKKGTLCGQETFATFSAEEQKTITAFNTQFDLLIAKLKKDCATLQVPEIPHLDTFAERIKARNYYEYQDNEYYVQSKRQLEIIALRVSDIIQKNDGPTLRSTKNILTDMVAPLSACFAVLKYIQVAASDLSSEECIYTWLAIDRRSICSGLAAKNSIERKNMYHSVHTDIEFDQLAQRHGFNCYGHEAMGAAKEIYNDLTRISEQDRLKFIDDFYRLYTPLSIVDLIANKMHARVLERIQKVNKAIDDEKGGDSRRPVTQSEFEAMLAGLPIHDVPIEILFRSAYEDNDEKPTHPHYLNRGKDYRMYLRPIEEMKLALAKHFYEKQQFFQGKRDPALSSLSLTEIPGFPELNSIYDENTDTFSPITALQHKIKVTMDEFIYLFEKGADPSKLDCDIATVEAILEAYLEQKTPREKSILLFLAINKNAPGLAHTLLQAGADPSMLSKDGYTPIELAAKAKHWDMVRNLITDQSNPSDICHYGTVLLDAVEDKQDDIAIALLEAKASVDRVKNNNMTAMHYLAKNNNGELMQRLTLAKASPFLTTNDNKTPLEIAISKNLTVDIPITETKESLKRTKYGDYLLAATRDNQELTAKKLISDYKAVIDLKDDKGMTPLHFAAQNGNPELVKCLLEAKANPAAETKDTKETPLELAVKSKNRECIKLFIKVNLPNKDQLLLNAINRGNTDLAELLLLTKANTEVRDSKTQKTPLYIAAGLGHEAMVRRLLDAKADAGYRFKKITPIEIASENKHWGCVNAFAMKLKEIEGKFDYGSALVNAASHNQIDVVKTLLDANATLTWYKLDTLKTALHFAAEQGNAEMIDILLKAGANASAVTKDGKTALQLAIEAKKWDCVITFLAYQKQDPKDAAKYESVLCAAAADNNISVVATLLDAKISPNPQNTATKTPLYIAAELGNEALVCRLLDAKADAEYRFEKTTPITKASENKHWGCVKAFAMKLKEIDGKFDYGSALVNAASSNQLEVVKTLLDANATLAWYRTDTLKTALHLAAELGNVEMIDILLKAGANTSAVTKDGKTALQLAIEAKKWDCVVTFIKEQKQDPKDAAYYESVLSAAVADNNISVVATLLEAKISPNPQNTSTKTPLYIAAELGNEAMVCRLLDAKADAAALSPHPPGHYTPIEIASTKQHWACVKTFAQKQNDTKGDYRYRSALVDAARSNQLDVVQTLLKAEASPNSEFAHYNNTQALHYAAENGNCEMIQTLLVAGADSTALSKSGKTPIKIAFEKKQWDCIKTFVYIQQEDKSNTFDYGTILLAATEAGKDDVVRVLLEAKCDPNIADTKKNTPLHIAAKNNNLSMINLLLEAKANISSKNNCGYTPIVNAAANNHWTSVNTLIKATSPQFDFGITLHLAIRENVVETAKALLDAKCLLEHTDAAGMTPLHLAIQKKNMILVNLLLEAKADTSKISNYTTPIQRAAEQNDWDCVKVLAAITPSQHFGSTLRLAARAKNLDLVTTLLELKANPDGEQTSPDDWSPLHYAATDCDEGMVLKLLEAGANPFAICTSKTTNAETPLTFALEKKNAKITNLLTDPKYHKAEHNYSNALYEAAFRGRDQEVKLLLDARATPQPSRQDIYTMMTPLHIYARRGDVTMTRRLLDAKADASALYGHNTNTAIEDAALMKEWECVEALAEYQHDTDNKLHYNEALIMAAEHNQTDVVETLLRANATLIKSKRSNDTALQHAVSRNNPKMIKSLLLANANRFEKVKGDKTVIDIASEQKCWESVKALTFKFCQEDELDSKYYSKAFVTAAESHQHDVVDLILNLNKLETKTTDEKTLSQEQQNARRRELNNFNRRLNDVIVQADILYKRNTDKSKKAAEEARALVETLNTLARTYIKNPRPDAIDTFRNECHKHIKETAEKVHRITPKALIINSILAILGVGILYGIATYINYKCTGDYLFFNRTRTMCRMKQLDDSVRATPRR